MIAEILANAVNLCGAKPHLEQAARREVSFEFLEVLSINAFTSQLHQPQFGKPLDPIQRGDEMPKNGRHGMVNRDFFIDKPILQVEQPFLLEVEREKPRAV